MNVAKIEVSGTTATVIWSAEIPKGLVGGKVQIDYVDDAWAELNKTVVFRGAVTRDVLDNGSEVIIPAEVLSRSGVNLYVGVYGTDAENDLGIPTFWAKLGVIRDAADPNDDPAADPSLPIWARLLERTPDWQAPPGDDNHILNRTHWTGIEQVENTFDGNLDGKKYLSVGNGYCFVKMSDRVLTQDDLVGAICTLRNVEDEPEDILLEITESMIEDGTSAGYPALLVGEFLVAAYRDFNIYGLYVEKGVYFLHYSENGSVVGYVHSLSVLPNEEEVVHKLDDKYLNAEWMAGRIEGSEEILGIATQPFSGTSSNTARQTFQFVLEGGHHYEVTWDGEVYQLVAGELREGYIAATYIGNLHLLDDDYPDTEKPFAIACLTVMGIILLTEVIAADQAESHTFGINEIGQIRNRIPFKYMPRRYVLPSDFSYSGIQNDELEKAYFHMLNGGEVYANYANSPYKVLMIDFDVWDNQFHSLVMTDGDDIMMWSYHDGWIRHTRSSFMLKGADGKKYQISVNSEGNVVANATSL